MEICAEYNLDMSGRMVHALIRGLDAINRLLRRPPDAPPHIMTGRHGEEEAYFYLRRLGYVMWPGTGARLAVPEKST